MNNFLAFIEVSLQKAILHQHEEFFENLKHQHPYVGKLCHYSLHTSSIGHACKVYLMPLIYICPLIKCKLNESDKI